MQGAGCRAQGAGRRAQGAGHRAQGAGRRVRSSEGAGGVAQALAWCCVLRAACSVRRAVQGAGCRVWCAEMGLGLVAQAWTTFSPGRELGPMAHGHVKPAVAVDISQRNGLSVKTAECDGGDECDECDECGVR